MNRHGEMMGQMPLPKLLAKLAIPAVIANLVNSLYNIVDQIFIGQGIGYLGNAATSIAFPLTTICLAFGLMFGVGGAANFNLSLGKKEFDRAKRVIGTSVTMVFILGVIISAIINLNLTSLLNIFGATENNFDLAKTYMGITAWGIPFLMFSTGTNPLVRADGSSRYSMIAVVTGAIINTILDPLFIFVFHLGIAGAAYATIIGQIISALMLALYFRKFKSVTLRLRDYIPQIPIVGIICWLGISSFIFQSSQVIIQIMTNNLLRLYGAQSVYGSDIPIAISGIVIKLNAIFIAVIIGIVQGSQPIISYNYGSKQYDRVLNIVKLVLMIAFGVSVVAFIIFEFFPHQLISLFGGGSDLYFTFGDKYVRVFLMFVILNGIQIASTTFFQAIGKAFIGAILSLTKQIIFLLPLLLILPHYFGVEGIMYAGPVSDFIAFCIAFTMLIIELRKIKKMQSEQTLEKA